MSGPWERFAPQAAQKAPRGPWERFAAPQGTVVDDGGLPQPTPAEPAFNIDWNKPTEDIRREIAALPEPVRKQAVDEWAKQTVARERAGGTKPDLLYNLAAGTPIGSWLDEGEGLIQSGIHKVTGGRYGRPYDETVAIERERQKQAEDNSTKLGELPYIGDVRMSGVQKLLGGLAAAPVTPMVNVVRGAQAMLPRMANAAATGVVYGGVYGAGEGEGSDRAVNAAIGAGVGGTLGTAAVPVARGLANVAGRVQERFRPMPAAIQNQPRGSVERVAAGLDADNLSVGPAGRYPQVAAELGPDGMLADMGPNLRSQAGALANSPGEAKNILTTAIEGRREAAPTRINDAMTTALGKPKNIPQFIDDVTKFGKLNAEPFYNQFYQTPIKPTPRLADLLERARAAGAFQKAERLMQIEGINPNNASNNGMFMDLIKRSVDDMAYEAKPGSNEARLFKALGAEIRKEVDGILVGQGAVAAHPQTGKPVSVWEVARTYAGDYKRTQEAVEAGQKAFSTGVHPDQMAADLTQMGPLDQASFRYGARDAARTKMGNASAAYGPSGDVAARRAFQSDFAKDKMRQIVGDPKAAELARVLSAESEFARTQDDVLRNSKTADRLAAQKMYPAADKNANAIGMRNSSLTGFAFEAAYRLGNALAGGAFDERRARIAESAARMLISQGMSRDALVAGLQQYIQRQRLTQAANQRVQGLIEALGGAARQPAISGSTID